MKKSILIAVLGVAACAATSYGQGYVVMNSYLANAGNGAITTLGATPVNGTWTAELYFALGTVVDPGGSSPGGAFTAIPSSLTPYDANGDGYFQNINTIVVPGYSSGAISFEIVAIGQGNTFSSSSFTESLISSSSSAPPSFFGDNGPGMPNLVVPVPEPTTLALAGLGGLASLVAFRRKQA
jgi:hypothetical protein